MAPSCPVDLKTVNQTVVRLNALQISVITIAGLISGWYALFLFLAADFALRISGWNQWSPVRWISYQLVNRLQLPDQPVDRAPKRFAASVGLLFSISIGLTGLAGLEWTALVLGIVLLVCALLEALVNFCVGCWVYMMLIRLRLIRNVTNRSPEPA
ncbi:MAG: DUF4395 domain-containing protein [Bacteroidetes bacterium]|nr:DUF4395 domain-containing protein [Bacteroidota bacterium]